MAVTMNRGLVDGADPLSNELKIDMREKIAMLDVDVSQFSTMLMKLPSERANSFKVEWLEDEYIPRHSALSASATSAETSLSVTADEGHYFKAGDIIRITSTGEACRVVAQSASAISVVRGLGTVSAASAASGAKVVIVGGSNEEGATSPDALITQRVQNYNYTQIVRNVYRFTETAMATAWYGGPLQAKERRKKAIEHKRDIENMLFFGARSYTAGTNNPRRTSGGLIEYISTNITDAAGSMTRTELNDFLRAGLEYGNSSRKVLFCAPLVAQVFSEFLANNWVRAELANDPSVYGVKVDALISGVTGDRIPVVVKNDWKRFGESSGQYGTYAFLVDMENVQLRPLRDSVLKPNRQTPDADEQKAEFIAELSLAVEVEESHSLLKNVTGSA